MNRKKLYYSISLAGLICISIIINLLSGCAKEHNLKPIHFRPAPPPEIPSQELPPVATASPIQAIRIANAYFEEAQKALQKGDKKTAQEKYLTARRTLISGGIVPGIFSDLESWEKDMLPEAERKINLESLNTYKIIEGLKGSPPYSSITIPFPVPEKVLYEIEDAQTRYPDRFQEGLHRSGYYVPYIRESLKKAGLPQELCWLAMVESMYKLKAYSSVGAAGMWQFIRSTGEHYNMRINSYIDERYNWVIATSCAIEYLINLHNFFKGNWELAISAYNMGEGALMRKIEANGGDRNFWKLIETPPASYEIKDETKKYLPRFLAYILICNDPVPYGFSPSPYQPIKWDEVEIRGMYALDALDKAMGYTPGTLSTWNPFLVRGTTPPTGCKLMLPAGDGTKLSAILNNPSIKQAEVVAYTVKKGETAYHIAKKYDIPVNELLKVNGLNSVKSVKPGMEIQVPLSKREHFSFAKNETKRETEQQSEDYHLVKKGETLFAIGKKYGIEVEDLAVWNNMKNDQRLKVGDKISLKPVPSKNVEISQPILQKEEKVQTKDIYHVVKSGDTINGIAKIYSTKPEKIMEMNHLSSKSILHIGQRLLVGKETIKETTETKPTT
ncbi:MAG: LysM peptidoglycan-binding domain-containing protein, partial [Candidatus Hydrogenedens sp.]